MPRGRGLGKCSIWLMSQGLSTYWLNSAHASSLPVISLLTCCQKEVLKACICLYSQAARHSGILPPPPSGHKHYLSNVPGLEHFLAKDPPPRPWVWAIFGLPARGMQSIYSNCLLVSYFSNTV